LLAFLGLDDYDARPSEGRSTVASVIDELRSENAALAAAVRELAQQKSSLEMWRASSARQRDELKEKVHSLQSDKQALEETVEALRRRNAELLLDVGSRELEHAMVQRQLDGERSSASTPARKAPSTPWATPPRTAPRDQRALPAPPTTPKPAACDSCTCLP